MNISQKVINVGDWVPKEEWEAQQNEKRQQVKPPFIIPSEVKKIISTEILKEDIQNFLTCICNSVKNLYGISNGIVKLRCSCGIEYGYPDDHYYFNLKKTPIQPAPTAPNCTCRKCHVPIEPAQAKSSLGFVGRELCGACMGAELA